MVFTHIVEIPRDLKLINETTVRFVFSKPSQWATVRKNNSIVYVITLSKALYYCHGKYENL